MSKLEAEFEIQLKTIGHPCAGYKREYTFAKPRRFRFDFAWTNYKVAVEIEGGTWVKGRHTTGKGFQNDCEKYNLAAVNGWIVIRGDSAMVRDGRLLDWAIRALEVAYKRIPF